MSGLTGFLADGQESEERGIDYEAAASKAFEQTPFWKPEAGVYKVRFESEGRELKVEYPRGSGDFQDKVFFDVLVSCGSAAPEKRTWSMTKGSSPASTFVQLALVGARFHGLKGCEVTVIIKQSVGRDGKPKRDYTVQEALELSKERQAAVAGRPAGPSLSPVTDADVKNAFL